MKLLNQTVSNQAWSEVKLSFWWVQECLYCRIESVLTHYWDLAAAHICLGSGTGYVVISCFCDCMLEGWLMTHTKGDFFWCLCVFERFIWRLKWVYLEGWFKACVWVSQIYAKSLYLTELQADILERVMLTGLKWFDLERFPEQITHCLWVCDCLLNH